MLCFLVFFFFNDTATTEIYTLSLHDALPISGAVGRAGPGPDAPVPGEGVQAGVEGHLPRRRVVPHHERAGVVRSGEHTAELQSRQYPVCRLLLEKKNTARSRRRRHSSPPSNP